MEWKHREVVELVRQWKTFYRPLVEWKPTLAARELRTAEAFYRPLVEWKLICLDIDQATPEAFLSALGGVETTPCVATASGVRPVL
ncbi:MAG: hypothetical protein ABDH91_09230 [Bacteroidia bacterium]